MSNTIKAKHGATKFVSSILRIIFALLLVKILVVTLFFALVDAEMKAGNVDGPAPVGNYGVRRTWGEGHLGVYFDSAEAFIMRSKTIEHDIGIVVGVAPRGGPNKHGSSFGESWTKLNLQVIGEKGEGVLTLSEFNWDGRSGVPNWKEKHWLFHAF